MSNLQCPFYNESSCLIKTQCTLPEFKSQHNCGGLLNQCSFFIKEKIKQLNTDSNLKIIIKRVDNTYLVKADALVYPINDLLEIDDPLLNRMTLGDTPKLFSSTLQNGVKIGHPYLFKCSESWKTKQKYIITAVISSETYLVNETFVVGAMKKTILLADENQIESLVIIPCDKGTHDISLISMAQLSAIFTISQKHEFKYLKKIFICMEDKETEQSFIEYYNRIFGGIHGRRNNGDAAINT